MSLIYSHNDHENIYSFEKLVWDQKQPRPVLFVLFPEKFYFQVFA